MTDLQLPDDGEDLDPAIAAIASAILDGGDTSALSGDFRLVADIAQLHRSLSDDEAEAAGFPPEFPWRVGSLTLTAPLGRGTYGEVFRAWDNDLHRDVAVKLLFAGSKRGDASARAREEGRLLARIRHPNVVTVHAVEQIDGRIALVTEFIKGRTLQEIVRASGPLPAQEVARLGLALCGALEAVHDAGLIHRDIKPQNVMLDEGGRIVLTDFGASHAVDATTSLAGTPLYIAPEIFKGAHATERSDIYSLGVLLHYAATGSYPVAGASIPEIRDAHASGARTLLRSDARVPRTLADAIDTATNPDPALRYATAADFARALQTAANAPRATRKRRAIAAVVAAAVLLSAVMLWQIFKPRPIPDASSASEVAARVTLPPHYAFGGPSFDGRYVAFIDNRQNIVIQQTGTAQTRTIVQSERPAGAAEFVVPSADGTQAAYMWRFAGNRSELRVIQSDDRWPNAAFRSPPPLTLASSERAETLAPVDWSRDGSQLLVMFYRVDGGVELRTHAADGSAHRVLQTFRAPARPRRATFSPDGRFVVYDLPAGSSTDRALFAVPSDGSRAPVQLDLKVRHAQLPVFSADGAHLFFVGAGEDGEQLWRARFRDGAVSGSPRVAATHAQGMTPIGVTSAGDFYYSLQTRHERLFRAALGTDGSIAGAATEMPGDEGISRRFPAWSPKGDALAYVGIRGMNLFDFGNYIGLLNPDGSARRSIAPPLLYFAGTPIDWSPDGRSILIRGKGADGYWGYHIVDAGSGATTALVTAGPRGEEQNLGGAGFFGPDGRSLVWRRGGAGLLHRDLRSGEERVLVAEAQGEQIASLAVSHQHQAIAFVKTRQTGNATSSTLNVLEPDGSVREIARQPGASPIVVLQWTPDGNSILFASIGRQQRMWRVSRSGGTPVDLGVTFESTRPRTAIRPDGRELVYATGSTAFETWVLKGIAR